ALLKALFQVATGEWQISALVDLRLVDQAKLKRIHFQFGGHFVHGRLDRIEPWNGAWASHRCIGSDVATSRSRGDSQVGSAVQIDRGFAALLLVIVKPRYVINEILLQTRQPALACCCQANSL